MFLTLYRLSAFLGLVLTTNLLRADEMPNQEIPELAVLENYIGKWDSDKTGVPQLVKVESSAIWTLDSRFVQQTASWTILNAPKVETSTSMYTYDQMAKCYRMWHFRSTGVSLEAKGSWDAVSKTMFWKIVSDSEQGVLTTHFPKSGIEITSFKVANGRDDTTEFELRRIRQSK